VKAAQLAALAAIALLLPAAAHGQRPRLLGLSHAAFRVSDLERARAFYEGFLGYTAVSPMATSPGPRRLLILLNQRQYLELVAGLDPAQDRLDHVALLTDDLAQARSLLAARRIPFAEAASEAGGNPALSTRDAEGRALEIVEHARDGWPRSFAPAPPDSAAISPRMLHAGVLAGELDAANRFYASGLGLQETWRGSRDEKVLSWTNLQVPDGEEYIELMLYGALPAPDARGTAHHVCLEVADIERARARLLERGYAKTYGRPLEIRTGVNRRRQLNLYDPDGTRVELMEPRTVDGQPVPSSQAPPPRRPPKR
jgi:lactoylglutathione lyase